MRRSRPVTTRFLFLFFENIDRSRPPAHLAGFSFGFMLKSHDTTTNNDEYGLPTFRMSSGSRVPRLSRLPPPVEFRAKNGRLGFLVAARNRNII